MSAMDSTSAPAQFAVTLTPAEVAELQRRLDVAEAACRLMRARLQQARERRADPWGAIDEAVSVSRRVL